jgi:hypothetical protein
VLRDTGTLDGEGGSLGVFTIGVVLRDTGTFDEEEEIGLGRYVVLSRTTGNLLSAVRDEG